MSLKAIKTPKVLNKGGIFQRSTIKLDFNELKW